MKAVIITGGKIEDAFASAYLRKECPDCIIAADSGMEFCQRAAFVPDYLVGDFDSVDPELIGRYRQNGNVPIDSYNPVKDMTDTDIALEKALALGADEVHFLGATGSRLDHTLSNIFNLYKLYSRQVKGVLVDPHNRITMPVGRRMVLKKDGQYGRYVSLFPFRGPVEGLTLTGFAYPLCGAEILQGDGGLCVSNQIREEQAVITWEKGILLVMETDD